MRPLFIALLGLACCFGGAPLAAQEPDTLELAAELQRQRQRAGFRVGLWDVDSRSGEGVSESTWPLLEGFFQRGLGVRFAVESSVGAWRRERMIREAGVGSPVRERATVYVVPLLTALKWYPFTTPDAGFHPFVLGGAGFALGIEEHAGEGTLLGGAEGTNVFTGFGLKAATGAELRLTPAVGAAAALRWQWIRFGDPIGGERTYAGPAVDLGLTYRFQN